MKINIPKIIATFLTLVVFNSCKTVFANEKLCLEKAFTQKEMNKCSNISYQNADNELNRVYKLIREIYHKDQVFIKKLKKAQQAWIELRDADFELYFPYHQQPNYYGKIFPTCANNLKSKLTLKRVEFLKQWVKGSAEGEACSGSIQNSIEIQETQKNQPN